MQNVTQKEWQQTLQNSILHYQPPEKGMSGANDLSEQLYKILKKETKLILYIFFVKTEGKSIN